ncbi:Transcription factor mbp1 [Coemansia asiatica]|uniref:Transcription factor mbp1 n=1 Tax=Coemansia asiatica TaxID=1052880 RepID=A0A9W7XMD6_9FUNG|nr:Transcription factor mbp1 [Coemansia asiatica]
MAEATQASGTGPGTNDMSISTRQVWSASYAGVEVFQLLLNGTAIMRRRKDSYINATQILKCAQFDKPHRTRFLEKEVHTGIHEKVQGGYGKYQGTWVPLERARALARELGVYELLRYLFEYNPAPGEKPPTAPRSLESMYNKRKSKENAANGAEKAPKRRVYADITGSKKKRQTSGSLSSILNSTADSVHASAGAQQQRPQPTREWQSYSTAAVASGAPQTSQSVHPSVHAYAATPPRQQHNQQQNHYQQQSFQQYKYQPPHRHPAPIFMTPESPGGYARHQHYQLHGRLSAYEQTTPTAAAVAGGRRVDRQAPPPSLIYNDGNNGNHDCGSKPNIQSAHGVHSRTHSGQSTSHHSSACSVHSASGSPETGRVLRDISNTHHAMASQAPNNGSKSSAASLLTPPASAIRRPGPLVQRPPASPSTVSVSASTSASVSPRSAPSRVGSGLSLGLGCVSSAAQLGHSADASAMPSAYAQLIAFVSQPRATHARASSAVEQILRDRSSSLANAVVCADGRTLLHVAAQNGHWNVVQALLDSGASPRHATHDGRTALMLVVSSLHAWRHREPKIFEWLVDSMAVALGSCDSCGRSVLHWASMAYEPSTEWPQASAYYARLLVDRLKRMGKADLIRQADSRGRSPADTARHAGLDETAVIFAKALQPPPGADRYDEAVASTTKIISAAAAELRHEHRQQQAAIDADTQQAAVLLLDLRREHEAAQQTASQAQAVHMQCQDAQVREAQLKRQIKQAVNLQQAARFALVMQQQPARPEPQTPNGDPRAELRALRQSALAYEQAGRRLASEYADLAAMVRPWPRPPLLSHFDGDDSGAMRVPSGSSRHSPSSVVDSEAADVQAITAVLAVEEQRLQKFERVVAAACGDLSLDKVRTVVEPVLSVLNNGNTL